MPFLELSVNNSSYATNALSASYALTASYVQTQGTPATASYAITASYALNGGGGTTPTTFKRVTGSYALQFGDKIEADSTNGTFILTAPKPLGSGQTIEIQDPFASWANHNVTVTGSINGTGSLILNLAGSWTRLTDVSGSTGWRAV